MAEKKRAAQAGARAALEADSEEKLAQLSAAVTPAQPERDDVVPDQHVAWRFLHALDPEADTFTFQTFDDGPAKRSKLARIRHGTFDEMVRSLDELQRQGAGVFVTINETDGKGRQAHNIKRVRALFLDLDGAPLAPVLEAPLAPNIIIESSLGKYHAYWLCNDCPLDQFERVQRALAMRFGGDPSVHDLPRVMRLPGFQHLKKKPFTSRLLDNLNSLTPPYTLAEIVGTLRLDLTSVETNAEPPLNDPTGGKIKPGGRHSHLFASGRSMARRLSREAVRAALAAENQARCDPPLPDADIDYLAERAFEAKDAAGWVTTSAPSPGSTPSSIKEEEALWPEPLEPAAFHGLVGQIVRLVGPESEADPAAILVQALVRFGAAVGRGPHGGPYYRVEADKHFGNLFGVLVGETSKARKGTSLGRVREIFRDADLLLNEASGLSSGEGLKFHVRDPIVGYERDKKTKALVPVEIDPGVLDKRLLVIEPEFSQVLKQGARSGNTLSPVVRCAYDTGDLKTLTKTDPVVVTGAHIAILGHITTDELRRELTETDSANGFANRFLYVAVRRSKMLPFGGAELDPQVLATIRAQLRDRITDAKLLGVVGMTDAARLLWSEVYQRLSEGLPGMLGAITARAEAQCSRLALVYALLDGCTEIDVPHLQAALAVWKYCEASARYIFGSALGDPAADEILRALRAAGSAGLTRTEISYGLFKRHKTTTEIDMALQLLQRRKLAYPEQKPTAGRASEIWRAGWR